MNSVECSTHLGASATHLCDGCERSLCERCLTLGHRLLTCNHCGELAVPLDDQGPANTGELERARARRVPYSTREAFEYPLRGSGALMLAAAAAYLMVLDLLAALMPGAGPAAIGLGLMILILAGAFALLVPGLSFRIVGSTIAGETEVPDWPAFTHYEARLAELLAMVSIALVSLLPAVALVGFSDCRAGLLGGDLSCIMVMLVGLGLGVFLWVPAVGAVGYLGNPGVSIRWDLHLRALAKLGTAVLPTVAILAGLFLASAALSVVFSVIPVLGVIADEVVRVYVWFVGMHLVGLLMRQHEDDLQLIYFK